MVERGCSYKLLLQSICRGLTFLYGLLENHHKGAGEAQRKTLYPRHEDHRGDVLEYLASGMTHAEILADFPYLTEEDIRACLAFAADRERKLETVAA